MTSGRPPGPLRKYTIQNAWPMSPGRWRVCVAGVDEATARRSAGALLRMRYPFRVLVAFKSSNGVAQKSILASEWSREGIPVKIHNGDMAHYLPTWAVSAPDLAARKN